MFRRLIVLVLFAVVLMPSAAHTWMADPQYHTPMAPTGAYFGFPHHFSYDPVWGWYVFSEPEGPFLYRYYRWQDGGLLLCSVYWGGEVCYPVGA